MYMPELARFTARDPLPENDVLVGGIPQSSDWYANNNPTNMVDPSGLQVTDDQLNFEFDRKHNRRCVEKEMEMEKEMEVIPLPLPLPKKGCSGTCFTLNNSTVLDCKITSAVALAPHCPILLRFAISPSAVCSELKKMITPKTRFNSNTCSGECSCTDREKLDGKTRKVKFDKTKVFVDPKNFKFKVSPQCQIEMSGEITIEVGKGWVGRCAKDE